MTSFFSRIHDVKKSSDLEAMQEQLENIFQNMKKEVEEKHGRVECDLTFQIESPNRMSTQDNELQRQNTLTVSNLNDSSDGDNRSSYNSQVSYDQQTGTPNQVRTFNNLLVQNFGGITRRKSNASTLNRADEARASNHSYSRLNTTVENVMEELQTRVIITDNTRRNHGMYLTTSTPCNSRSPSNSNRDSLISTDSGPPTLPMKRGGDSNDNHSLSNFDANSNASGSREDICSVKGHGRYSMKKPPPPPPPVNVNGSTPPMPRRKPPFRSPTD